MQFLDRTGVGTLWSMCKIKFALAYHTHDSLDAVGNEQISATAYSSGLHFKPYFNSGGPTTFGNILEYTSINTGGGQLAMEWTSSQTKNDGTDSNVGRVYYRSKKDNINGWTKWMTLAYTDDVPTKLSQLNNDKGFVTGSVSGNTVTINGASTTWTNTWRGIQDNLTSSSTSDSLSANQGKVLKGLVDSKVDYSDLSSYAHKSDAVKNISSIINKNFTGYGEQILKITYASNSLGEVKISDASNNSNGFMSISDKKKLDNIADFANNYTLPTASETTLGGIKVSKNAAGTGWPICVNGNGLAQTKINGLTQGRNTNSVTSLVVVDEDDHSVEYKYNGIDVGFSDGVFTHIDFPPISGTFALTSDIPDISNLCKFNFVNSVSECSDNRINFFIRCSDTLIDLDPFNLCPDGTILLITTTLNSTPIKHHSGIWYSGGDKMNISETHYTYKDRINLITKNNGTVHHYEF